jgi:pyrroloquinoline quinone biosynthesis protein B
VRGQRLADTPTLPELTDDLLAIYRSCDTVPVDGTFWSNAELTGTPLARAIGHISISGEDGTIALLTWINVPRRIFVHINYSHPVLKARGPERQDAVEDGWQIGCDGWRLT